VPADFFNSLIPSSFPYDHLDCSEVRSGSALANSSCMPDVQISSAAKNSKRGGAALVVAVVLGAVGIFIWLGAQHSTGASESVTAESTLPLETFVVNLTGSSQRAYLRVGITLGLAHPLPRNQAEAVSTAPVRDTILSILATSQPDELLKIEGKRQLKDELLKALQERVPQLAVENVYFTEFLVQM
jgi:flagellar basal body-associated protein FliL